MHLGQPKTIQDYASNRNKLLEHITRVLQVDDRFVAAWLTGSFGRGDADNVSDLDLTVVVENTFAKNLCFRPRQVGANTTPERYALLSQFGQPHIIHENHHNAPQDGTFTFVLWNGHANYVDDAPYFNTNGSDSNSFYDNP